MDIKRGRRQVKKNEPATKEAPDSVETELNPLAGLPLRILRPSYLALTDFPPVKQSRLPDSRYWVASPYPMAKLAGPRKADSNQLLETFLRACTVGVCQHRLISLNDHFMPLHLDILPLEVLQKCFRLLLVLYDQALILCPDGSTPPAYRTHLQPSLLRVCRRFYQIGLPLLYGENTFTTSSPATSIDFDAHLSSLPGKNRQLITKIALKIDWANQLWARFPLIARYIAELKALRQLEITIIDRNDPKPVQYPRDGPYGAVMLKSEKKLFKELIAGLKVLRVVKLEGFPDDDFAKALEGMVNVA